VRKDLTLATDVEHKIVDSGTEINVSWFDDELSYDYACDVLTFAPKIFNIVFIDTEAALTVATTYILANIKTGWISVYEGTATDYTSLITFATNNTQYGVIVYNQTAPDLKNVVNFMNTKVVFNDTRTEQDGDAYLPSLLGLISSCNVIRGCTNFICPNLKSVTEVASNSTAVASGQFILVNDVSSVRVAVGINSLTTTNGTTATEDMKYIETVEAMNLIKQDISDVFKTVYCGAYRNTLDNQMLLIASINKYFGDLAADDILDINYDNHAEIDVVAQKAAWVGSGKAEAATWTDDKVKQTPFKRSVYLSGDIKINGSMENVTFNVSMF